MADREVPVHIHLDFVQKPPKRKCHIVGSKGKIEWDNALFTTWANDLNHAAQFGVERGFAAGSDKGMTRAKPNIWSNMDDFQSKLDNFRAAAASLADTAAEGDPAASREQFVATGGTCKACHDEYKSKDYLY